MELRHLRYFMAVAEELHFSKAAERLHIAQPPLSQQIQQLEAELGVELFQRKTKRQVQLTDAGKVFLQEAYQLFVQLEQAIQVTRRVGRGEAGQLRVGFISSVTYDVLPVILRQFRERFPDVELVLIELTTIEQEQALRENRIEVGFVHPPLGDDNLACECVQQQPLIVALPEGHRLTLQKKVKISQLVEESFVLFPRQKGLGLYDRILTLCQQANFTPKIGQQAIQMQTMIGLVSAGMGIAIIPSCLQNLQRSGVVYRCFEEETPLVEVALAWRDGEETPILRQFLQITRLVCNQLESHALGGKFD
ncbi:MAG TPA: LysR family transcriptional regulator [Leptolyngbyaceae cyanobacterium]